MTREDLRGLVDGVAPEALPDLIGDLEAAKARALVRLTAPSLAAPRTAAGDDHVLPMPEVAGRLGLSLYTAREMGRRGELPVTKLGRRVGVRESSLRAFLERREHGGRA